MRRDLSINFINACLLILISNFPTQAQETSQVEKANIYLRQQQPYSACLALNFEESVCNGIVDKKNLSKRNDTDLQLLGVALRQLGFYDASETALTSASARSHDPKQLTKIRLSLANTRFKKYKRLSFLSKSLDKNSTNLLDATFSTLKQVDQNYSSLWESKFTDISIDSRINWLKFYNSIDSNIEESNDFKKSLVSKAKANVVHLLNINAANLNDEQKLKLSSELLSISYIKEATERSERLYEKAKNENSIPYSIEALNLLGNIKLNEGDLIGAKKVFIESQKINLNNSYESAAYKTAWNLAKIYKAQGDLKSSVKEYKLAVDIIDNIHQNLSFINPDLQFDFLDSVEPIYTEYIQQLFNSSEPNLSEVIDVRENLRIAELQSYSQCNNIRYQSLLNLLPQDSPDIVIYLIGLPTRYEVVYREHSGKLGHFSANKSIIDSSLYNIKIELQKDSFGSASVEPLKNYYKILYEQIISPLKNLIPDKGNIVFALESKFQTIPWSLLYDGHDYIIRNYSLSLNQGYYTKKFNLPDKLKPLVVGLSKSNQPDMPALDEVADEAAYIKQIYPGSKTLLNEKFTVENILEQNNYNVLHIASHAQFHSELNQSYIYDWKNQININDLDQIVKNTLNPLYLLVLSACETATGDNRSVLGIAGAAIHTGAASTVATLWVVNDKAQSLLMQKFYGNLHEGQNKAQALQNAQLSLLDSQYRNPYFWASNILIGDWR